MKKRSRRSVIVERLKKSLEKLKLDNERNKTKAYEFDFEIGSKRQAQSCN